MALYVSDKRAPREDTTAFIPSTPLQVSLAILTLPFKFRTAEGSGAVMDNSLEEGADFTKSNPLRQPHLFLRALRWCKNAWMGMKAIPTIVLVPIAIVVFGLTMEARIISYIPEAYLLNEDEVCTVKAVDPCSIEYHSGHRFYSVLKEMEPLPPLTFREGYAQLCHEELRTKLKYGYCLPISGRKDVLLCTAGDRADLLNVRSPKSVCFSSVLHMLMVDVYEEMKAKGNTPLITFGSLLGAVRNHSMIPFTEDADIAFVEILKSRNALMEALLQKGYHMFFYKIWRVCVAPTHPLATRLYDPSLPLTRNFTVPYVDLYRMKKRDDSLWDVQEFVGSNGRFLDDSKVEPFSQVMNDQRGAVRHGS